MIDFYKPHEANEERENDFPLFLEQCKRAMNKIEDYKCDVNSMLWSICPILFDKRTMWQILKDEGQVFYQDEYYSIDFDYGRVVYAESRLDI